MKLRSILFWSHLTIGCLAGVVILVMSVTGVLLTYERQIVELVERQYTVESATGEEPLPVDQIIATIHEKHASEHHFFVRSVNREGAAIPIWAGANSYLVDPYSGNLLQDSQSGAEIFFNKVTQIHRWFAIDGEGREAAQAVTAYSNLMFLFLIASGIYLWLPRVWRWHALKIKILFNVEAKTLRVRNFNWHHLFGFWAFVPLFFIAVTATVFHFPWVNSALYRAFGEEVPVREEIGTGSHGVFEGKMTYDTLLQLAKDHAANNGAEDWHSIWMQFGETPGKVRFYIDRSLGRRPEFAYALFLDSDSGEVLEVKRHGDWSKGDQAWDVARFLHTGELYGFVGQTIAGLASLASCFLVYTGFSLGWQRLISSLRRKRDRCVAES